MAIGTAVVNSTDVLIYACRQSRIRDWVALAVIALEAFLGMWNLITDAATMGVTQVLLAAALLVIVALTWIIEMRLDSVEASLPSGDPE
ncbi:MAG: hypothetical protein WBF79_15090 [Rhodococcus sp. (in: high G+C Gram-positive bacteria)]